MKIQNISLPELANEFGTPFYVYDGDQIKKNVETLRAHLPEAIDIYYSVKANPNISICALLNQMGLGAEVCSMAELETAFRAGFPLRNIIFVGPGKKTDEIERAYKMGLNAIVCESIHEINQIEALAKKHNRVADIAIRINPEFYPLMLLLKIRSIFYRSQLSYRKNGILRLNLLILVVA